MIQLFHRSFFVFLCLFALQVQAQDRNASLSKQVFQTQMRAVSEISAISGKTTITLWGVSESGVTQAVLKLKARVALDQALGQEKAECTLKSKTSKALIAQCVNHQDVDLGLFMLQNGYAIVDRSVIYGTVFEKLYVKAEAEARGREIGIWSPVQATAGGTSGNLMLTLGFLLFLSMIAAFGALSYFIMKGFRKTIEAQNKNMDISAKERVLKDKERQIFASMLDTEIKANKSKIEAYLIVYDEMLKSLQDTDKTPKYQMSGDIVQEQPALSREVFDRNTDKLDVLGRKFSSEIIHFYARIKTNAEYINLEPDASLGDVVSLVEKSIRNANRLNSVSDRLIDLFSQSGFSSNS